MLIAFEILAFFAIAAALPFAALRRAAALSLLALAVAAGITAAIGVTQPDPRTLEVTHSFAAFVGNDLSYKNFPIETTSAPAFAWASLAAVFLAAWSWLLWSLRPVDPARPAPAIHPFWMPMTLAISGIALVLAFEKLAAPRDLVTPYALDRVLLPATIAAAIGLAARCRTVLLTLSWLSLFVALSRLPIVTFGTLATRGHWGTSLDVHATLHFANPLMQRSEIVESGSSQQLAWLLWTPHLLIFPALYMMSTSGFALARIILEKGRVLGVQDRVGIS